MEERVSFEVAMLAKKVNFNKPCTHIYEKDEDIFELPYYIGDNGKVDNSEIITEEELYPTYACTAPSQAILSKWLREIVRIFISVVTEKEDAHHILAIQGDNVIIEEEGFETYEEALEKGLKEVLKHIQE